MQIDFIKGEYVSKVSEFKHKLKTEFDSHLFLQIIPLHKFIAKKNSEDPLLDDFSSILDDVGLRKSTSLSEQSTLQSDLSNIRKISKEDLFANLKPSKPLIGVGGEEDIVRRLKGMKNQISMNLDASRDAVQCLEDNSNSLLSVLKKSRIANSLIDRSKGIIHSIGKNEKLKSIFVFISFLIFSISCAFIVFLRLRSRFIKP
ncbi:hypothetical protein PCE1_003113 [Barthelona sp. PCE]